MDKTISMSRSRLRIVEEIFNSTTHGLGAIAGIIGLVLGLATLVAPKDFTIGFIVYGVCLVTLMTASTLYHALIFTRSKPVFRILDHSGIFLLIAGSYTPLVLKLYSGWSQLIILAIVWGLAISGIVFRAALPKTMSRFGVGIYIALGWLALIFIPKLHLLPIQVIWLVAIGGLLYTFGAILLAIKKPFIHVAWHMCVVAAAVLHFFAITKLA